MKRALVLQHTPTEGPEQVAVLARERGMPVEVRRLDLGERVPADVGDDDLLILMGGPMGVGDVGDARFPFLAQEIALCERLIARDHPMLGICLGAQLLAAAAGVPVYPNTRADAQGGRVPAREVGWGPVDFLGVDREPALRGMRDREMLLHWHGDTFDLPSGAVHLASTELCPHQAFRLGRRIFALQFHCELGAATIATWVREDAAFVALANGPSGGERILADTARYLPAAAAVGDRLLRNILEICSRP